MTGLKCESEGCRKRAGASGLCGKHEKAERAAAAAVVCLREKLTTIATYASPAEAERAAAEVRCGPACEGAHVWIYRDKDGQIRVHQQPRRRPPVAVEIAWQHQPRAPWARPHPPAARLGPENGGASTAPHPAADLALQEKHMNLADAATAARDKANRSSDPGDAALADALEAALNAEARAQLAELAEPVDISTYPTPEEAGYVSMVKIPPGPGLN